VTKIENQLVGVGVGVGVGGGVREWTDSRESGPEVLGVRAFVTLLFPQ